MTPASATRCYRLLLNLLPAAWRAEHGDAMVSTFESLAWQAARTGGRGAVTVALVREVRSLLSLATAPSVRAFRRQRGVAVTVASLQQDLRYALRTLRAKPGFTLAILLTLVLSIGSNTAIFSVVHAVVLKPLPYPEPERLVTVGAAIEGDATYVDSTSPATFYDWRAGQGSFERLSAYDTATVAVRIDGEPEQLQGMMSAGSVLATLGAPPLAGRLLADEDDKLGRPHVVVLGEPLAKRLFGGAAAAVGHTVTLGNRVCAVVGVMPASFHFPDADTQFWVPAQLDNALRYSRTEYMLLGIGRLRRGVSLAEAEADLNVVMARIRAEHPRVNDGPVAVRELKRAVTGSAGRPMLLMLAAVGVVLLIACANLANLLLARASTRTREMAVRQALGAGRGRIMRQLLTESLLLSLTGGLLGLLAAERMLPLLVALLPEGTPRVGEIRIDRMVTAVTFGLATVSGIAFGLTPALLLARSDPAATLHDGPRVSDRNRFARTFLVGAEVALATMLLIGAGLLVRSFVALQRADPGIQSERLLTFSLTLPNGRYPIPTKPEALRRALARLEQIPGVQSAAAITQLPVTGRGTGAWFNIIGRPTPAGRDPDSVAYRIVTPNYFRTAGIRLVRGRLLNESDERSRGAVVIDEALARRYWREEDPIGREIVLGAMPDHVLFPRGRIVGIVSDVKQLGLGADAPGMIYVPHRVTPFFSAFSIMVRTSGEPRAVVSDTRRVVRAFDPALPLANIQTMDEILARSTAPTRVPMLLLAAFAAMAVGLAVLGVFGVLTYSVNVRRRELGIRVALGAGANAVRRLVLRDGLRPAAMGIAIGVAGALAFGNVLEGLLYGVRPADPATFGLVTGLLLACSVLASYLPARRATEVDPIAVLKSE